MYHTHTHASVEPLVLKADTKMAWVRTSTSYKGAHTEHHIHITNMPNNYMFLRWKKNNNKKNKQPDI